MERPGETGEWKSTLVKVCATQGDRLLRAALAILRDLSEAEDACQQAILKALRRNSAKPAPANPFAWLMKLTVNEALNAYRRKRTAAAARRQYKGIVSVDQTGSNEDQPRGRLFAALEQLPEQTRHVVVLRIIEGHSGNDVAELLECSPAEVSRRLYRGMEALRQALPKPDRALRGDLEGYRHDA